MGSVGVSALVSHAKQHSFDLLKSVAASPILAFVSPPSQNKNKKDNDLSGSSSTELLPPTEDAEDATAASVSNTEATLDLSEVSAENCSDSEDLVEPSAEFYRSSHDNFQHSRCPGRTSHSSCFQR